MVSGAGMIDFLRCQSFEKLVIDAEIIAMAKRLIAGIEPRDTPLALELMKTCGHRADFLAQPHTHRWFRQELHIPSGVIDRGSLEAWQTQGKRSIIERAQDRITNLLETYQPTTLSDKLRAELRAITTRAAQKHGMDSLPPLPK